MSVFLTVCVIAARYGFTAGLIEEATYEAVFVYALVPAGAFGVTGGLVNTIELIGERDRRSLTAAVFALAWLAFLSQVARPI